LKSRSVSEPGVFLIKPDQTLYYLFRTVHAVRPTALAEMVQALDFVIKNDYPARGKYTAEV
jgi:hypothetical protein